MHAYLIGLHPRTRGHPLVVLLPFLCFSVIIKKGVLANPALHTGAGEEMGTDPVGLE